MKPATGDLTELTATEALALMRTGQLSPVGLLEALLGRIAARDPLLGAWVRIDREGALAAARAAERAWREGTAGPLAGIPVAVKDIILTRGMPTRAGFAPFQDFDPGIDAHVIVCLRAAGAIILGKVETTQFAGRDPSPVVNPWHPERTASGSSSGSAVAVADRMVPLALATQTGGSTLRPAAYMGVVGFSPTSGRVSRHGLLPRAFSFDTIGVMARSVDDAGLLFPVIAGPDPRDPGTPGRRRPRRQTRRPDAWPRLTIVEDLLPRVAAATADHFAATIARLTAGGAQVRRARLPVPLDLFPAIHTVILLVEAATSQAELLTRYREHYAPGLRAQLELGGAIPGMAYVHAQRLRRRARLRLEPLLRGTDALVLPATPDVAPDRRTIGPLICQVPWTVLGWPSIAVPGGLGAGGLPLGVQLVGAPRGEASLLAVAHWVEGQLGRPPGPGAGAAAAMAAGGAR